MAPGDIRHLTTDTGKHLFIFLLFEHIQLGLQHLHGLVLVHMLRTLILTGNHNTCGEMRDTDGGRRLVNVLTAGTTGTVSIDTDIVILDLYFNIISQIRHDITGHKGCLTLTLGIKRRNTYQTMNTFF